MGIPILEDKDKKKIVTLNSQHVQEKYNDAIFKSLSKNLPPHRRIDHGIELLPGRLSMDLQSFFEIRTTVVCAYVMAIVHGTSLLFAKSSLAHHN